MKKMHRNGCNDYRDVIESIGTAEEDIDIKLELELQLERERKSAEEFPEFYRLADMMESREGASYRSGSYCGKRFMSHDDFYRIILEKTRIPLYDKDFDPAEECISRPAAPYQVLGCGREMVGAGASVCENVIDGQNCEIARVESSDTDLRGFIRRMIEQWFPAHTTERQDRKYRRRLGSAAAGIAWAMIFVLVLALPIVLGVLKSEAITTLNLKRDELRTLEKTEEVLRAEFESSLDLRQIEDVALNEIGMIKLNDSTVRLLRLNEIDTIESFSDKKSNPALPALLSALGIRAGDE